MAQKQKAFVVKCTNVSSNVRIANGRVTQTHNIRTSGKYSFSLTDFKDGWKSQRKSVSLRYEYIDENTGKRTVGRSFASSIGSESGVRSGIRVSVSPKYLRIGCTHFTVKGFNRILEAAGIKDRVEQKLTMGGVVNKLVKVKKA